MQDLSFCQFVIFICYVQIKRIKAKENHVYIMDRQILDSATLSESPSNCEQDGPVDELVEVAHF